MSHFRGLAAGETLMHILHQGGGAICLAVPKDAETEERAYLGRVIILTREFIKSECVGLWSVMDYFTALKNIKNEFGLPSQVWMPGKKGFGEPVVLRSTDLLLKAARPSETAYLAAKLYAAYDSFLSGSERIILDEDQINQLAEQALYNPGKFLQSFNVPELTSITLRRAS